MIRWMLWGRQWGKSYQTLEWFKGDPVHRVIITPNLVQAEQLRRELANYYPHGPDDAAAEWHELLETNVVSLTQWSQEGDHHARYTRDWERFYPEVAIDNLDMMLKGLVGADVSLVTASGGNDTPVGLVIDPRTLKYPTID